MLRLMSDPNASKDLRIEMATLRHLTCIPGPRRPGGGRSIRLCLSNRGRKLALKQWRRG